MAYRAIRKMSDEVFSPAKFNGDVQDIFMESPNLSLRTGRRGTLGSLSDMLMDMKIEDDLAGQAAPKITVTLAAVSPIRRTPALDATTVARSALTAVATPGPAGLDTPTLERLRPKPIDVNNISVTPQRFPDSPPSPSQRLGGPRSSEAGPGAWGHMATPNTPYGAHWSSDPSPNSRKYYKKVLDGLPRQELSEIEINQMERFRNPKKCSRAKK